MVIEQCLTIKGNDKNAVFSQPYLNDNKELTFRFSNLRNLLPHAEFVLNEEKKGIEIRGYSKKILVSLENYKEDFKTFVRIKKEIIRDLAKLSTRLLENEEDVVIFETGLEEYPYLFTSQTIIDNGIYSCKYNKALIYSINKALKKAGKNTLPNEYDSFHRNLGKVFKSKVNFKALKTNTIGEDKYYSLTVKELVDLF